MTPIPDYDSTHKEQAVLDALCRPVGAQRPDAFGSAVRADFDSAASDLDSIVEFEPLVPIRYADAYSTSKSELEDLFGRVSICSPNVVSTIPSCSVESMPSAGGSMDAERVARYRIVWRVVEGQLQALIQTLTELLPHP